MGKSWSLTTIQAASSWRMSSSWPTHWTASSSGCARCSVTPSISTVIVYPHYETRTGSRRKAGIAVAWGSSGPGATGSEIADHDAVDLEKKIDFLPRDAQRLGNRRRGLAVTVHAQRL